MSPERENLSSESSKTFFHTPVLVNEIVETFMEQPRPPARFFEGTFGRGGHALAILKRFPRVQVVSFDRDQAAVDHAQKEFSSYLREGRLVLIRDDFRNLSAYKLGLFDGALLDLGVSSPQLEDSARGFSFMHDGPLDMRMDQTSGVTAADIINNYSEKELSDLFYHLGEVRHPNRVVRAIVHDRKENPFQSTLQLASMIARIEGWRKKGSHPATGFFMALRIAVNQELEGLEDFLESMHLNLEPGSRLAVISFHSLEDRIVKNVFRRMNKKYGHMINKKVIIPSEEEIKKNPRSRSSKLRIFEMGGFA